MGKNQAYKAMQRARLGSSSAGPEEIEDGMTDGSFHSPEWHAARLASLKTSHTITWEEFKRKQKEDELRRDELEADKDRMMREYRAQLDAERARKLSLGKNHSASKSHKKKDRKDKDSKKRSSRKRKKISSESSSSSSSSESSSGDDDYEDDERESRKSRSKRSKKKRKHKSRVKHSSSDSDSNKNGGPVPLSKACDLRPQFGSAICGHRNLVDRSHPLLWQKVLFSMGSAELTTEEVLKMDIPWETYMSTKLITGTHLQLLRRYDKKSESQRAALLDDDGPAYVAVFINILRDISKEETVEYVLALIDEMLTANPKRARLFHDKSLSNEDTYQPFLRWLQEGNWFIQEKSCKILTLIVSARPKGQHGLVSNGESSHSKSKISAIDAVLEGLLDWLCLQLKAPTHPNRSVPLAVSCLATLLRERFVRVSFVQADGVKLLIPLISPASTQQSIQLLYETCLCIWLLSYYDAAIDYLATTRVMPRLVDVVKGSTKEKVVRVIVLTLRNLLPKAACGAQMIDLGLPQIVQSLKAQAWSDEDLLEALNQLEDGLKEHIKTLSSFDKYKQEVLLGHLDWYPMHKDPGFWRENITNFEENDFQILRVLITILDTSGDPTALAVACYDLSQFIQYHPAGRIIVSDLKAKDRVMKLMNHENADVTKNALLCIQRLFLGAKYASFLQS
ncbi:unnamed protein product [Musa banksii]